MFGSFSNLCALHCRFQEADTPRVPGRIVAGKRNLISNTLHLSPFYLQDKAGAREKDAIYSVHLQKLKKWLLCANKQSGIRTVPPNPKTTARAQFPLRDQ
jgi:hypothetical protein